MLKKYVGKNRAENLDWLLNRWLKEGPPVCFLQGFPGVGKTNLARDFRDAAEKLAGCKRAVIDEVPDRATPSVMDSLLDVSDKLSRQGLPEMEKVLLGEADPDPAYALEQALGQNVVIVLDEAQRFFRPDSGTPLPEMNAILEHLRYRQALPGRLLLLSDRVVESGARWSEWIPIRELKKLEPSEALEAFDDKLAFAGITEEIPAERKQEIVQALDYNPRAIETLVASLAYETLDDVIGHNQGLWDVHDREISRDFLNKLERELLERTMAHLDHVVYQRLLRLSVHRKSFEKAALELVCGGTRKEWQDFRDILVTRFLMNQRSGWLSLNPIVREISLGKLKDQPADFSQAHERAVDYHFRHFKPRTITAEQSKLGASFAELRYHLAQTGRKAELREVVQRFTDFLKRGIKSVTPVPTDREELDERIAVLSALLEEQGADSLEYHLTRCLKSRGRPGDWKSAIIHVTRITRVGSPADNWFLRAELEAKVEGLDAALRTVYEAIHKLSADSAVADIYGLGANLLAKVGKTDEAVALLKEGIKVIPPDKSLFSLYQVGADLLTKVGKTDEAVALLKEGIKVIPPDKNLFSLYQISADILAQAGKTDEAVALLKEGIKVIPPDKNLFSLYQTLGEVHCRAGDVEAAIASQRNGIQRIPEQFGRYSLANALLYYCAASGKATVLAETLSATGGEIVGRPAAALSTVLQKQLQDDWEGAAQLAKAARIEFPRYTALALHEAFCHLAARDAEPAWEALKRIPNLNLGRIEPISWLAAFIQLRRGARPEASAALAACLGRPVDESRELNESFLLRLWDQQEIAPESSRLCFYFPIMPASLSGLSQTVRRVPFGKPVLPQPTSPVSGAVAPVSSVAATVPPEIYVSYAWGEDSTETGRQREEIVNRLCDAVKASGRAIGRDKEELRGGDSIDRFAQEISKAQRIIAVISEKSLQSKYCMVMELFSAWRRCNHQLREFQEKVIALVLDDAKPLLADDLKVAKLWKEQYEKEKAILLEIDPDRHSSARWAYINQLGQMCPELPDILGALKDIVMKRGFDDIVKDNFQEVLSRIPPLTGK